jgi:nitrogenase molybdenum-iron protein beta chain
MSEILENPHGNCALGGANATLSAIHRVIALYHSGPGCCMQTTAGEASQGSIRMPQVAYTSIPCTNMLEREVVFGGEDKLRKFLKGALEVLDGDVFFVLTGCTAGIIGDDVKSVADEFSTPEQPVYAIETAGFLGESYRGYEIAMQALLNNIVDQSPGAKQPDLVNLLGVMPYHDPYWEGNLEELTRLLEALGLRVNNFFTIGQGLENIRAASSASLNIIVHPWLLKKFAGQFEQRWGIPSLRFAGAPLGAVDTANFLRQVAKATGKEQEAEALIEKENRWFYRYLETGLGLQSWRKFSVVGESADVIPIVRFLCNEYSFTPELAVCTDVIFRPEDKEYVARQLTELDYPPAPEIVFTGDQWEINQALARHPEAALLIGSTNEHEFAMSRMMQFFCACYPNSERLIYNRSIAGWRGALTFMEDIYSNL